MMTTTMTSGDQSVLLFKKLEFGERLDLISLTFLHNNAK